MQTINFLYLNPQQATSKFCVFSTLEFDLLIVSTCKYCNCQDLQTYIAKYVVSTL